MATPSRTAVRRLAVARLISLSGGAAAYMALNFAIYQRTKSATWVAAALFLTFGTTGFASIFAGSLGDRLNRQKVMIASDLTAAACFAAMSFVHSPGLLLAVAFCSAVAEAPFLSASSAAMPNLVGDDQLAWANSLVTLGRNAGIVIGPLLGGLLVSTAGAGWVFGANAVSFVVSAAFVASIRARFNADRAARTGQSDEHQGIRAGFRFIRRDVVLRTVTLAWVALVLGLGMTMVADVALVQLFGAGSFGYGALIACWGGGSILGSLLGRFIGASKEAWALLAGAGVVAGTSVVVGVSPWFGLALGAIFVMGIGDGVSFVAQQGLVQRRAPDAVRSRVSSAFDAVVHIGMAISYVLAGPAVAWLGAKGVYVVGGLAAFLGLGIALPILRQASFAPAAREPVVPAPQKSRSEVQSLLAP
jgi:MFS family permease